MDVLVLSQYYHPEPIPKPHDLALALTARGHSVSVITGVPNYPQGRLYSGFHNRLIQQERIEGIPVVRTYEFPYHGRSALGRILNYASFMLFAPLGLLHTPRADVMYVWHPPLTIGLAAWLIARMRGIPFVYDVQDIWPETAVVSGVLREGTVTRLMSKLERFIYKRADFILVPTEGARQNLIGKGVPPKRVAALPHWIDERLFATEEASALRTRMRTELDWSDDRFVVLFAGNLGLVQGLDTVLRAATLLHGANVTVVFVGAGADRDRLMTMAAELNLGTTVQFIERQPVERMPAFMAAADALLVHLRRSELSKWVIPSKTLAYLAAGRPILMAMEGAAADLVADAGGGVVIPPDDPDRLAKAIQDLQRLPAEERASIGVQGQRYLRQHLSKSAVIARYEEVLRATAELGKR